MKFLPIAACVVGLVASVCLARVEGPRQENTHAAGWAATEFPDWVTSSRAVLTPETLGVVSQACLRNAQQATDFAAYGIASSVLADLSRDMEKRSRVEYSTYVLGLYSLSRMLVDIDALKAPNVKAYEESCRGIAAKRIGDDRDALALLFEGRMHPRIPEELAKKGLRLVPLTWDLLVDQICKPEGYYSTSRDARLWKFFSLTRALGSVLTSERNGEGLATTLESSPQVLSGLRKLNAYGAVAGKLNGAVVTQSAAERLAAPVRLTGPAVGSRAPALLGFFTTAWREALQKAVMQQDYPQRPFQLISLAQVLGSVAQTSVEVQATKARPISQTELGMADAWKAIDGAPGRQDYGAETATFQRTAALAWLALNAEANVRQNEKIAGLERVTDVRPTRLVFGAADRFAGISAQMASAAAAYRVVDTSGDLVPECVGQIAGLADAASAALSGHAGTVAEVAGEKTEFLTDLEIPSVIVDIGMEVKDDDDGVFSLHLATGHGREVPARLGGRDATLWTPGAMVLHLPTTATTAEWQGGMQTAYDR